MVHVMISLRYSGSSTSVARTFSVLARTTPTHMRMAAGRCVGPPAGRGRRQMRLRWRPRAASPLHEVVQLRRGHDVVEVVEGAPVLHLTGGVEQATHRRTVERGGEADPPDTGRRELGHREGLARDANH